MVSGLAEAWRAEILQYTADNFPALVLTSAFMERLQSSWSLENLQVPVVFQTDPKYSLFIQSMTPACSGPVCTP